MKRRLLSAFLAVMMVLTMAPVAIAADDAENTVGDTGSSESAPAKTLQQQIDGIKGTGTVTLDKDYTEYVNIPKDSNITLDLNGHKISSGTTTILNNGTLIVRDSSEKKNGVIESTGNVGICVGSNSVTTVEYANIQAKEGAVITSYATDATITIKDGVFTALDNAVVAGNGSPRDGNANVITINGGTFTGNIKSAGYIACGIYAPWKDIITVNGGNFTVNNGIGIVARAGQVTVNGGTFTCTGSAKGGVGDKKFDMDAAQCVYFDASNPAYSAYNSATDYIKLQGGTFSSDVSKYCEKNYYTEQNEDNTYTVKSLKDVAVAQIGDTYYKTLAEAVSAANNNTVTLLKDTAEDVVIPADKMLTIDLAGHKLTNVNSHTIFNKGTLTINGNKGTVDNVTHGKVAVYNIGTVSLNGGTYDRSKEDGTKDSNTYYTLLNHGTMTVRNVTVNNKGGYSSLFENGYFDYSKSKDGIDNPTLTIESGTFTGGINTVKNDDGATMTINGGIFTNYAQSAFQNHNIATINGGTFNGATVYAILNCGATCSSGDAPDQHQLTITGGNFNGKIYKGGDSKDGKTHYDIGSISISGGYFTTDPSAYVASGYVAGTSDVSGYSYKVVEKTNTGSIIVKPAVAEPEVNVSDKISESDKAKVEDAAKSVEVPTLGAAAGDKVAAISKTDAESLVAEAPNLQNPTLYVQTALKVEPTAYNAENKTLALEITPQYRVVASTATTADEIKLDKNAQVVQDYQPMNITKATVVTMELPDGFAVDNGAKLSIQHTKSNGTVEYYTGTVTEQNGKHLLTFTTNGFSPFVISVPAASIGENVYPTLQAAVENVKNNNETIKLAKDVDEATVVTVAKSIKFTVNTDGKKFDAAKNIVAGSNTTVKVTGESSPYTYEFTYTKPSSGGSSGGSSSGKTTYKVTTSAVNNGGVNASPSNAEKGAAITITLSPDKGYKLDKLTVTDGSGKTVSTVKKSDTVYTFTMPASAVKVGVSYVKATETPSETKFNDVSANDWFASAVDYVTGKGMMNGTADNTFSPKANTTRGMVVTVLYRLENQPSTSAASFTDVASGAYYANAVAWANANGIVSGYGSGKFGPNDKVTREQLAAILYRYAQYKKYDVSVGEDTNILSYDDAQSISSYAIPAIQWACGAGVVTGKSGSKLDPKGNATRAEVAAMLMRFCENVK